MILGINQPYYLPYTGLFDRIKFCDKFIINGYAKLNRKRANHRRVKIVQLHPAAVNNFLYLTQVVPHKYEGVSFCDVKLDDRFWECQETQAQTLLRTYRNAPYFYFIKDIIPLLTERTPVDLGEYNFRLIYYIADKLGLADKIINITDTGFQRELLTQIHQNASINASSYQNWLICKYFSADEMIVGQNGPLWINEDFFESDGIKINYQKIQFIPYRQFSRDNKFIPGLSVVDLLFNCGEASKLLIGRGSQVTNRENLVSTTNLTGR